MDKSLLSFEESIKHPFADVPIDNQAVKIAEDVLWLRLPLPMALNHVNLYAFYDSNGWTLIDSGMNTEAVRQIMPKLMVGPLEGLPIKRVILTHHHPDHVGMAGWFQTQYDAEILATQTAWLMARMLTLDVQDKPSFESLEFYRRAGVPADMMTKYEARRPFNFADCVHPIPLGFRRIKEGDELQFGGQTWRVHIGHGHAPSHATFWSEDSSMVVGGDQFLADITPNIGVYPTEPEANPLAEWLDSCKKFQEIAADQLVLPGHKKPFTGLRLRLEQLIDNHLSALERIKKRLLASATTHDILEPLFKRQIHENDYGMAIVEAVAHMNWLHQAGVVQRNLGNRGEWIWSIS